MGEQKAFQDYYPEEVAHCYGCGRLNPLGHQLKSYWEVAGETAVAHFTPQPYHTAVPGYVYGGLIASLIDCHSTGTAAAAAYHAAGRSMDSDPLLRFLTASLKVDYLKPTPINGTLTLRARATEIKGRKVTVETSLFAGELKCARGTAVCVQVPEEFMQQLLREAE